MFRRARESDLPAIIAMLADDALGSGREAISDPIDTRYTAAFAAIDLDRNQLLAVAVDDRDNPVGCLQLTFIPGLSRTGMWRGIGEGGGAVDAAKDVPLAEAAVFHVERVAVEPH